MSATRESLVRLLQQVAESGASEMHLKVPAPPLLRIEGRLVPTRFPPLRPGDVQEMVMLLCGLAGREYALAGVTDLDFAFGLHGAGRFLVTIYRQRGSLAARVRRVPTRPPKLSDLGLGGETGIIELPGLVLLAGDRSADLLHALVSEYNAQQRGHVVVLESPLSYLHRDSAAAIAQREVGVDVADQASGVRAAVGLGVDLLAIGELDGPDAVEATLWAAERGHTVIAVSGAPSAELAVWWLTRRFYGEHREVVQRRIELVHRRTLALSADERLEQIEYDPRLRCAM